MPTAAALRLHRIYNGCSILSLQVCTTFSGESWMCGTTFLASGFFASGFFGERRKGIHRSATRQESRWLAESLGDFRYRGYELIGRSPYPHFSSAVGR